MKRWICTGCFLFCMAVHGNAQYMKDYADRLLFNIYTANPEPSIKEFLKLYIPALSKQSLPGTWTKYTAADTAISHSEIHSFIFKQHPFLFTEKIAAGQLDFYCTRYGSANTKQNITGVRLKLSFDTELEMDLIFSKLIDVFLPLSTNKQIGTTNNILKAAFVNRNDKTVYGRVKLSKLGDATNTHPYKVIFELGNDVVY